MNLQQRLEALARVKLQRDANQLRNDVIDELSHPGTGRTYRRGTVTHTASAPGSPPAVDTGRLRQSIGIDSSNLSNLKIRVGTNVDYAAFLEFGGRTVAPRPFIRTALQHFRARP